MHLDNYEAPLCHIGPRFTCFGWCLRLSFVSDVLPKPPLVHGQHAKTACLQRRFNGCILTWTNQKSKGWKHQGPRISKLSSGTLIYVHVQTITLHTPWSTVGWRAKTPPTPHPASRGGSSSSSSTHHIFHHVYTYMYYYIYIYDMSCT